MAAALFLAAKIPERGHVPAPLNGRGRTNGYGRAKDGCVSRLIPPYLRGVDHDRETHTFERHHSKFEVDSIVFVPTAFSSDVRPS